MDSCVLHIIFIVDDIFPVVHRDFAVCRRSGTSSAGKWGAKGQKVAPSVLVRRMQRVCGEGLGAKWHILYQKVVRVGTKSGTIGASLQDAACVWRGGSARSGTSSAGKLGAKGQKVAPSVPLRSMPRVYGGGLGAKWHNKYQKVVRIGTKSGTIGTTSQYAACVWRGIRREVAQQVPESGARRDRKWHNWCQFAGCSVCVEGGSPRSGTTGTRKWSAKGQKVVPSVPVRSHQQQPAPKQNPHPQDEGQHIKAQNSAARWRSL